MFAVGGGAWPPLRRRPARPSPAPLIVVANSPREWLSPLAGDGVVDIGGKTPGFSAKYAEVAEAVLHLPATWAEACGAGIRAEEHTAVIASSEDATRALKATLAGEVPEYAASLARSWRRLAAHTSQVNLAVAAGPAPRHSRGQVGCGALARPQQR